MALAEKGNNVRLDITEQELARRTANTKDSSAKDMYTDQGKEGAPTARPLSIFAKAVGRKLSQLVTFQQTKESKDAQTDRNTGGETNARERHTFRCQERQKGSMPDTKVIKCLKI